MIINIYHRCTMITIALILTGCSSPFSVAEQAVRLQLKDPDAAEFRNERFCGEEGKSVIEGEYNGKSSYGAYEGFKRFYFDQGVIGIEDDDGTWLELIKRCTEQIEQHTRHRQAHAARARRVL